MLEKLDDPACSDIKPAHSGAFDFTALAWPKSGDYLRA